MAQMHWARQAYLCSAFAYPMGYMLVHAIRDDVKFSKFYVNRLAQSPSDNLSELFESELFKANIKGSANVKLTLTDELEPQTYGSFLISPGAEIQLPLRMAFGDVEGARELGKGLELDMGIPSSRRKVDMNTHLADEMVTRMVLSKQAKEFAIQRELIRAQSGTMLFCQPAMWAGIIGGLYSVVALTAPILGPIISCAGAFVGAVGVFTQINKKYKEHKVIQLDKKTIEFDLSYVEGARDYLKSSMRLGRYLRKVLGEDAAKSFAENGDCMKQPARYSTRLAEIESYLHEKEGTPLRRRRVKVKEAQVEDELESD